MDPYQEKPVLLVVTVSTIRCRHNRLQGNVTSNQSNNQPIADILHKCQHRDWSDKFAILIQVKYYCLRLVLQQFPAKVK